MNYIQRARELLTIDMEGLAKVRETLGEAFEAAVTLLVECQKNGGRILVTGLGKSYHIGQKISATMISTGTSSALLHPSEAMHGDLGMLQSGDVLLTLSYSGESDELLRLLPLARRMGAKIVSITANDSNSVARLSDCVLPVSIDQEACPFNLAPTTSTLVTLAIGDTLAMILHEARGFTREDYGRLHPGGAIGQTLHLEVRDVMRETERAARITLDATVRDAVIEMTRCRSGAVAVLDDQQQVRGILTDGDLRRHLLDGQDITAVRVESMMTPNPITLNVDHPAADAMRIFEQRNIDDLIITDSKGSFVGMVDIQDMPKMKMF